MADKHPHDGQGPFRADQLTDGDRYELSGGHPIYCAPAGREHAARSLTGAAVLETDPDVEWAGVDAGFSPNAGTLRAPDVAIGPSCTPGEGRRGWIPGAPPLAVEYASHGQDEGDLQERIAELLESGTRQIWVVRLVGPRRVEVYLRGQATRVLGPGETLEAPGLLRNPVPVEALYDREAGHKATLRNLLQRAGYEDLDSVRAEGIAEGMAEGIAEGKAEGLAQSILTLLKGRGLAVSTEVEAKVMGCRQTDQLNAWLLAAARVDAAERIFD